jgi:hypothetical protein
MENLLDTMLLEIFDLCDDETLCVLPMVCRRWRWYSIGNHAMYRRRFPESWQLLLRLNCLSLRLFLRIGNQWLLPPLLWCIRQWMATGWPDQWKHALSEMSKQIPEFAAHLCVLGVASVAEFRQPDFAGLQILEVFPEANRLSLGWQFHTGGQTIACDSIWTHSQTKKQASRSLLFDLGRQTPGRITLRPFLSVMLTAALSDCFLEPSAL